MRQIFLGDAHGRISVSEFCLGTIPFGTGTDEETAFAILDRFFEAGGTFIDTADNYDQWVGKGGESEEVIGRWIRSRGVRDQVVIATKVGARTTVPGDPSEPNFIGLAGNDIRAGVEESLHRLGVERIDLYYAHWDHRASALEERVEVFGELVRTGKVGVIGCSNTAVWRIEEARALARTAGLPGYTCVQQLHTYLWPRPDLAHSSVVTGELIDYARTQSDFAILGYKPLLRGGYTRPDRRPFELGYEHPSNASRLATLRDVAKELGATANQVVLAWMLHSDPPIIPVSAAGSVAQLDEQLAAVDLQLDESTMRRLDAAGTESTQMLA
ncbi:aldo/keto reductase [Actinopolymorpha alba]|uniref:aldo/keto reductase n=1 Tax=Actinopolymorpha alba TaxID=533267 RepID=UPI0003A91C31|nr:aldo/keto reductase [Actinopolymorpha alba]